MTLVMSMSGVIHTAQCRARGRVYKGVAPEIAPEDVAAFLRARRLAGCGMCLRDLLPQDDE